MFKNGFKADYYDASYAKKKFVSKLGYKIDSSRS